MPQQVAISTRHGVWRKVIPKEYHYSNYKIAPEQKDLADRILPVMDRIVGHKHIGTKGQLMGHKSLKLMRVISTIKQIRFFFFEDLVNRYEVRKLRRTAYENV